MSVRTGCVLGLALLLFAGGCKRPLNVVLCEARPAGPARSCQVSETGVAGETRLRGDILAPDAVYVGGAVRFDAVGVITCVGCDCEAPAPPATEIDCTGAAVSPGFINLHEHLTFANGAPVPDTGERYEHRHDWRLGLDGHTRISVPGRAGQLARAWAELRHLISGTTAIAGAGGASGLLRNLDSFAESGELPFVFTDTFPLFDTGGTQLEASCSYPNIQSSAFTLALDAYVPHLAEGIDANTRNEYACVDGRRPDGEQLVNDNAALIHGMTLEPADYEDMAATGASLVWSPRSNTRLYGDTARVGVAAHLGVNLALGTDWLATGSMNLQRELACAYEWNDRFGQPFGAREMWEMVTGGAAGAVAAAHAIGRLEVGRRADIAVFATEPGRRSYLAATTARAEDVLLVLRDGSPLFGADQAVDALATQPCDLLDVCGETRRVCTQAELGISLGALAQGAGLDAYPLFFCGAPPDEPSCQPARPDFADGAAPYTGVPDALDADGDGRPDAVDDCPSVFDPIRPVDAGTPPDADADGRGDACDLCPLDPSVDLPILSLSPELRSVCAPASAS